MGSSLIMPPSASSGPPGRKLGYRRDPRKAPGETLDRDAKVKLRSGPVPASSDNSKLLVDILDQGNLGSCVANGCFQAIRGSHVKQGVENPVLGSRLYGYWFARSYTHDTASDSGTFLRNFFAAINKFGFPPESLWPYYDDDHSFAIQPNTAAVKAAFDQHAPTEYSRIYSTGGDRIDDIKRALGAGFLVPFGTLVSTAFTETSPDTTPIMPPIGLSIAGGHCMVIVDHVGNIFRICNSWSKNWGVAGCCYFDAEYLEWDQTDDLWIVESAPRFSDPNYDARKAA